VFFRGVRHLPWSKWFLLLAFEHLEGLLSFEELKSIWNIFGERELRVHVELDEAMESPIYSSVPF
jgi:hypothetical protein